MTTREVIGVVLCAVGRHDWAPWTLNDEHTKPPLPVVRMWACRRLRCGRIESI